MRGRDTVEKKVVRLLFLKHHDLDTSIRNLSRQLGEPYSTIRDVVHRLEAEGVVEVLRLEREYIVRLRDVSKALERGYLDEEFVAENFGYITPLVARRGGVYLSDELYVTLPFKIKRHEAHAKLAELDLRARGFMDPYLAKLGEWPRLSLLFYRIALAPEDDLRRRWISERGLESLGYYEPAYGFFAFLLYALRKAAGLSWEEAYCRAAQLIREYVEETRGGDSVVERLVDRVIEGMEKACRLHKNGGAAGGL